MCSGIKIGRLNQALRNKNSYKVVYPGAKAEDIEYYCVRTLHMEKPDIVIVHAGTNQVENDDPFTIARNIVNIVKTCHEQGVNKVYVSEIIHRPDYPDIVIQTNNILRCWEALHDYTLIYNSNIDSSCICSDKVHLTGKGKNRLSSNFRRVLNKLPS